jgi:hypothetical protein
MFPNLSQIDLVHTLPSMTKPLRAVLYFRLSYQHLCAAFLLLHRWVPTTCLQLILTEERSTELYVGGSGGGGNDDDDDDDNTYCQLPQSVYYLPLLQTGTITSTSHCRGHYSLLYTKLSPWAPNQHVLPLPCISSGRIWSIRAYLSISTCSPAWVIYCHMHFVPILGCAGKQALWRQDLQTCKWKCIKQSLA